MSSAHAFPASAAAKIKTSRSSTLLPRFAWGVLAYNVLVVLWGAVVRATSSGAGCGDHWPLCNGVVLQTHPRLATIIELAHRMSSGVTVPLVLLLLLWTFRSTVSGHFARAAAIAATVLTLNEGLLGALTLAAHFLSRREAFAWSTVRYTQLPLAITGLVATLVVGAIGTLAALSDTLFPATSLGAALAQDFSGNGGWLLRVRILHPLAAVLAGLFICWLLVRCVSRHGERRLAIGVALLLTMQYGLGLADVALLAPVWMQIVHLLGADLMWIALVVLTARICVVGKSEVVGSE